MLDQNVRICLILVAPSHLYIRWVACEHAKVEIIVIQMTRPDFSFFVSLFVCARLFVVVSVRFSMCLSFIMDTCDDRLIVDMFSPDHQ